MTTRALECAEIRSEFVAGRVPSGPELAFHLARCPRCHELFENDALLGRRLAEAVVPQVDAANLFAMVERDVSHEVGPRARLRALPTRLRGLILSGVVLILLAAQISFRCRTDFSEYEPGVFWGVASLLGAALAGGVWQLLRGVSAPLSSSANERWVTVGLLIVPVLAVLLMPLGSSTPEMAASWGRPDLCFTHGALLSVPFVLVYWLFERRDRVPLSTLVGVGALAGICGNLVLHAACPSAHAGHLLVGHATIGVAWALLLAALSKSFQRAR